MSTSVMIATVALTRHERVLLVHRHPARANYPDCWDLPGGHVEPGESPEQAATRECLEELGVEACALVPLPVVSGVVGLTMFPYLATRWNGEPTNRAPEEHDAIGWFSREELTTLNVAHAATRQTIELAFSLGTDW